MQQLKTIDALLKFKNDGLIDPESIAPYKYLPPLDHPENVLCRVHATHEGSTCYAVCQAPEGRQVFAMCQENGLEFVGIMARFDLDAPVGSVVEKMRDIVERS